MIDFFSRTGLFIVGVKLHRMSVAQAVEFYQPDLLALSVSLHTHLVTLMETIRAVRAGERGAGVKILVGGRALADAGDMAQQLGADVYAADPNAAVALGNALVDKNSRS